MKLNKAIEIAKDCGLTTVGEAIDNIDYHALNIFAYTELGEELSELYKDYKDSELNREDKI